MPDATTTTTTTTAQNWFDRINSALLNWYSTYEYNQRADATGVVVSPTRTGGTSISVQNPWPAVIVIGVIVIGAVYVYKKA